MPREKSAGAIIYRMEGGMPLYLLLHYPSLNRKGGHWEFAKGHIEEGEDYEKTVRREVAEETGINDLEFLPGFKKHIKYFFRQYPTKVLRDNLTVKPRKNSSLARHNAKALGGWVFKLVTFFVAQTQTKDVKLSLEHIGFAWLPANQAIKKTTFKNSKLLLKEANEFVISRNL
jgi:8-oxo-dGTP pyrophosphatase MutT (NUDIX family)